MPITVACPFCAKTMQAPDSGAGRQAKCPYCGQILLLPNLAPGAPTGVDRARAQPPPVARPAPRIPGGPTASAEHAGQNRKPCPTCGAVIASSATDCRFCGSQFNSAINPYQAPRALPAQPGGYYQAGPLPYTEEGFRTLYLWFAILYGVGMPALCVIIGIFMLIAAVVLQFILLYRYWDVIQDGGASTTPGKAVGFLFIPFFNLYWIFIAIHRLAEDMERYCRQRSLPCAVNSGLALAYCILTLVGIVPYLNILAALVNLVLIFILWHQFKETAITILRYRNEPQAASAAV